MAAAGLGYEVDGPAGAPVVVLGSSLGSDRHLWAPQLPALTERFRVVRFDHRGHGASEVPVAPYSLAELGGDVVGLLDGLGVDRFAYVGISLGGMVGMWLAAHVPDRVDRLVLCCTTPHAPPPQTWLERAATVREHGTEAVADGTMARWFTPEFTAAHPDVVARTRAVLVGTDREGYAGCCEALAAMDLRPVLDRITARTLVIGGREDVGMPPAMQHDLAAAIPGATLEIVEAAHLATVEAADRCTEVIKAHLG